LRLPLEKNGRTFQINLEKKRKKKMMIIVRLKVKLINLNKLQA